MKYIIKGISNEVHQTFTMNIPNIPEPITFTLRYMPTQLAWYLDFNYKKINEKSIKLTLSPNLLRCYKNLLPFGLSVYSETGIAPLDVTDLSTGRVKLFILDSSYVKNLERGLYGR